ncbi:MAG: dTDP-4-amino-4,6-dideoxygalactose transaminase [Magnetospiraceae bacterium]
MPDNSRFIPFNQPRFVGAEMTNIADAVLVNHHISGGGKYAQRCESWLEKRFQVPRALLTHSCTAALEMSVLLADIGPGDEVIMPSFTFPSTANAVALRGGVPVFVDVEADTMNISAGLIEPAITAETKAILVVHYAGVCCDMGPIMDVAAKHGLLVIEDAAQSFLSKAGEHWSGTLGHLGCLSFHETKNVISGEGGALLVNDPALIARAEYILEKGTNRREMYRGEVDKYTWVDLGSSYIPSDLIAAFLLAQLEAADDITHRRQSLHERYWQCLQRLEGKIGLPVRHADRHGNGHIFYLLAGSENERSALIDFLRAENIQAIFHFVPLHSSPAGKRYGRCGPNPLTVTEDQAPRLLRLPMFYNLRGMDLDRVVQNIALFYDTV